MRYDDTKSSCAMLYHVYNVECSWLLQGSFFIIFCNNRRIMLNDLILFQHVFISISGKLLPFIFYPKR